MNADEIVRALRCVQEKHRNDRLLTFQTDVSAMARDAADMIESLQSQLTASQARERAAVETINRMAEYIVTKGRVDYWLCDEIPQALHLKHQPKNDGDYENAPCIACVAEYFMAQQAGEVKQK